MAEMLIALPLLLAGLVTKVIPSDPSSANLFTLPIIALLH